MALGFYKYASANIKDTLPSPITNLFPLHVGYDLKRFNI